MFELYLTDSFQREVIHSSGGCESSKNKIIHMNINWWIRNIRPNYCISEFKCDLNSNRLSSKTCNGFRVIINLYTIDLYVVLIPQNESKWNKIVSIQTMSNQKILCLPPVANTLRDLHMRFTWVNRHVHAKYLKMIQFYSPLGIWNVFLYSINANIYHFQSMKYRQYA